MTPTECSAPSLGLRSLASFCSSAVTLRIRGSASLSHEERVRRVVIPTQDRDGPAGNADLRWGAFCSTDNVRPIWPLAAATGLPEPEVDKALQALLLRREVQCDSYHPPGRGGQAARWIGSSREALWSVHLPPLRDRRP